MGSDRDTARAAKEHLRAHLQGLDGVGGFGLGRRDDGYVITVTVARDEACVHVPGEYEGVAVEVRVGGEVRLLPADGEAARPDAAVGAGEAARPDAEAVADVAAGAGAAAATSAAAGDAAPADPRPDLAAHRPALRPDPPPR